MQEPTPITHSPHPDDPRAGREKSRDELGAAGDRMVRRMLSPLGWRLYMLRNMPLGLFAGLRITSLSRSGCATTVPYGWRSTNPFRSTYFAALSMAAELSTGALAAVATHIAPAKVSMFPVRMEAEFLKKATGTTTFVCEEGERFFAAVRDAVETGEPTSVEAEAVGNMSNGTIVAKFRFRWSFLSKPRRS